MEYKHKSCTKEVTKKRFKLEGIGEFEGYSLNNKEPFKHPYFDFETAKEILYRVVRYDCFDKYLNLKYDSINTQFILNKPNGETVGFQALFFKDENNDLTQLYQISDNWNWKKAKKQPKDKEILEKI